MKRFEIEHTTRFRYSAPITETAMELRVRPLDGRGQRCVDFQLEVTPRVRIGTFRDGYGNEVCYFNLLAAHRQVKVVSRSLVEMDSSARGEPEDALVEDFLRFRPPVSDVPGVRELALRHPIADPRSGPLVEAALDDLTVAISRDFLYDSSATNVYTAVEEVLQLKAGVCQDFAHLFIAVARALGVPARYVSGYIYVPGAGGVTEGASHAWAEAWVPGTGWVGYDATHPVRAGENHVRVALGRDYSDAAPTRGVYVGTATGTMSVNVRTRTVEPAS